MGLKKINSGKAVSVPYGLGISLLMNILVTSIAILVLTALVGHKIIEWDYIGYYIMVMLLISSFLGAKAALLSIKTQPLLITGMAGILFWMYLLCITALFFGGNYSSVFETALLTIGGSITAALLRMPSKKRKSRRIMNAYR